MWNNSNQGRNIFNIEVVFVKLFFWYNFGSATIHKKTLQVVVSDNLENMMGVRDEVINILSSKGKLEEKLKIPTCFFRPDINLLITQKKYFREVH